MVGQKRLFLRHRDTGGGIRTLERFPVTDLSGQRHRPLGHTSAERIWRHGVTSPARVPTLAGDGRTVKLLQDRLGAARELRQGLSPLLIIDGPVGRRRGVPGGVALAESEGTRPTGRLLELLLSVQSPG